MAKKKKVKPTTLPGICTNPGRPLGLWDFIARLQSDKGFAADFVDLVKLANNNDQGAIDCVNALLAPRPEELTGLGVPLSQVDSFRKCTESGLLVAAIARLSS
jgi:hypothetical protein